MWSMYGRVCIRAVMAHVNWQHFLAKTSVITANYVLALTTLSVTAKNIYDPICVVLPKVVKVSKGEIVS